MTQPSIEELIADFEHHATESTPPFKALAERVLPILRSHAQLKRRAIEAECIHELYAEGKCDEKQTIEALFRWYKEGGK